MKTILIIALLLSAFAASAKEVTIINRAPVTIKVVANLESTEHGPYIYEVLIRPGSNDVLYSNGNLDFKIYDFLGVEFCQGASVQTGERSLVVFEAGRVCTVSSL